MDPVSVVRGLPQTDVNQPLRQLRRVLPIADPPEHRARHKPVRQVAVAVRQGADIEPPGVSPGLAHLRVIREVVVNLEPGHAFLSVARCAPGIRHDGYIIAMY